VSCLTFNWNDTTIASGALDGNILLHNVVTGQASAVLRQQKTQVQKDLSEISRAKGGGWNQEEGQDISILLLGEGHYLSLHSQFPPPFPPANF